MITYKYKLYRTDKTKHLDKMLAEACFVWNHALALQKRYYRLYGKYIPRGVMQHHQAKRIKRINLSAMCVQEILERLETSYNRFFNKLSKRPPKFKKNENFSSIVFKGQKDKRMNYEYVSSCNIIANSIYFKTIRIKFKFSKSREYEGSVKRVILYRNKLGEYFIYVVTDAEPKKYGKSRRGASVGIDFGLKTYLTFSDGLTIDNPQYMKENLTELRRRRRNLDKCEKGSNNRKRKCKELAKLWDDIDNKRDDFQWKLAHFLCRKYDTICIEDLNLADMNLGRKTNRKLKDQAHAEFITKLEYVATKYGVVVHKIDRYYPSSKTCTCGYINKDLKLTDRQWTCPHCGTTHDRDLLAANNILRRGIYELDSDSKTSKHSAERQSCYNPKIS